MPAIYLNEDNVRQLVDWNDAVAVVEREFRRFAGKNDPGGASVANIPRTRAILGDVVLHSMSAASTEQPFVGCKSYATAKGGSRFILTLFNRYDGQLAAIIEAELLGQMRTGATTAVAARKLALPEVTELGLIGTGLQAIGQLAAVAAALPIQRALVYSRDRAKRESFAARYAGRPPVEIVPVERAADTVRGMQLVITATSSRKPVVEGDWLEPGTLMCAIGSNWWNRAEIDTRTVARADNVVCDSIDACRSEAGDFREAIETSQFDWSQAVNLADVLENRQTGRTRPESIVIFKSVGLALEDLALGALIVERARERGLGVALPF